MRDFTLSSHAATELQLLQRSFVSILITRVENKIGSDKNVGEWHKYATGELTYHVSQAIQTPYAEDDLACRLLVHSDEGVAAQVVAGSQRADADALSTHLLESNDFWLAANLNHTLSKRIGLTIDEKCTHMLATLDALKHVPKESQPGALGLQLNISGKLIYFNRSETGTTAKLECTRADITTHIRFQKWTSWPQVCWQLPK